ncbi:MAG: transposase [Acidobacteria bacterium]|nr:transposase [Acidobacteriota bacterium]MCA1638792.1 transposase [Acidobacteriota bacterium]
MATNSLELTPAMAAYLTALIYRNTRTSCCSLSRVCACISHDRLQRLLYDRFAWSRRLWDWFAVRLVRAGGYLILDDTCWMRWAKQSEVVSWVWSSTHGRCVRGMQVVLLLWTDGRVKIPLGMRLWRKGGKSKVALAAALLREAKWRGMCPKYVLFDSWYAASALLHLLVELGWSYVARLKSNRLFDGQAVRERWPHRFGRGVGRLRKIKHEVCVVKDGRRYFVTNDVELSPQAVKAHYRHRQQIEETFRLLKQEFGWGGASAQKAQAQRAHLHLGLYALCVTQRAALQQGQTIYAYERELFRLPIPEHLTQLAQLPLAA